MIYNIYDDNISQEVTAMDATERVYALMKQNSGYLTSKEARVSGVENKILQRMTERGLIERAAHGLYVGADVFPDPYYVAQYRCPKGVLSHETALFLRDLCDRVPFKLMMTIPSGWNTPMLTDGDILFFYSRPKWMGLGVCETETPSGVKVKTYDAERTLCDCLRSVDKLDRDLVLTGLKRYIKSRDKDSAKLLEYASALKIREMVYRYLEVLS
jgi:predicted transcriptional regulator of viral defense system